MVQGVGWGSCESLADWMRHVYWVGGRVRQLPSPYGVAVERGYTAQEDLESVNSYNMEEGRMIRVWFFHSYIPRPSWVLSALLSLGHHTDHLFLSAQFSKTKYIHIFVPPISRIFHLAKLKLYIH